MAPPLPHTSQNTPSIAQQSPKQLTQHQGYQQSSASIGHSIPVVAATPVGTDDTTRNLVQPPIFSIQQLQASRPVPSPEQPYPQENVRNHQEKDAPSGVPMVSVPVHTAPSATQMQQQPSRDSPFLSFATNRLMPSMDVEPGLSLRRSQSEQQQQQPSYLGETVTPAVHLEKNQSEDLAAHWGHILQPTPLPPCPQGQTQQQESAYQDQTHSELRFQSHALGTGIVEPSTVGTMSESCDTDAASLANVWLPAAAMTGAASPLHTLTSNVEPVSRYSLGQSDFSSSGVSDPRIISKKRVALKGESKESETDLNETSRSSHQTASTSSAMPGSLAQAKPHFQHHSYFLCPQQQPLKHPQEHQTQEPRQQAQQKNEQQKRQMQEHHRLPTTSTEGFSQQQDEEIIAPLSKAPTIASLPSTMVPPSVMTSVLSGPKRSSFRHRKSKHLRSSTPDTSFSGDQARKSTRLESPQHALERILARRGYVGSIARIKSEQACYDVLPSPLQLASYGPELVKAIHFQDVSLLSRLLSTGLSPNPCNQFRDSLLDLVCKTANYPIFQCFLNHGAALSVCDGFGRTPLHHCCWSSTFSGEIARTIIHCDWYQLFIEDKRGQTALEYVRKDLTKTWIDFLESNQDEFFPLHKKLPPFTKPFDMHQHGYLPDPENALSIHLARAVAVGEFSPEEIEKLLPELHKKEEE